MKVLFVGDIHNHLYMLDDVKRLDSEYNFDKIILFGDYIDDWLTGGQDSLNTLDKVFELKKNDSNKYILLQGNHELSYLGYPCSGHQYNFEQQIEEKLLCNFNYLDLYYEIELANRNFICSHAGLTKPYIELELLNICGNWKESLDLIKDEKQNKYLKMCSFRRGGNDLYSSLLWADRMEHHDLLNFNEVYDDCKYQIIGHSPVKHITNYSKVDKYDYWFIDTHSTYKDGSEYGDKSYLIWLEDRFEIVK